MSLKNGNRISKTVNQVTTTYAYSYDNRMTELHDGSTLTFTYNGDGIRQSRTVDGTTTRYVYDGVRLLKELDAVGATKTTYSLAPMGGEWYPLISDRSGTASRFYAFDALGTTRALANQSQLTTHLFTDDAYGNVLSATDPAATRHQYIGRLGYYADATSGLQLLTQRCYDAGVGRFVTEDPVRNGGNWCAYVGGAPTTSVDPSGLLTDPRDCSAPCGWRAGEMENQIEAEKIGDTLQNDPNAAMTWDVDCRVTGAISIQIPIPIVDNSGVLVYITVCMCQITCRMGWVVTGGPGPDGLAGSQDVQIKVHLGPLEPPQEDVEWAPAPGPNWPEPWEWPWPRPDPPSEGDDKQEQRIRDMIERFTERQRQRAEERRQQEEEQRRMREQMEQQGAGGQGQ